MKGFRAAAGRLAGRLHYVVFGHPMGEGMAMFLRQLSMSFIGLMTANAILFGAMLFIGRALGPELFGRFSLTIAVAQLLVIPMLLGMDVAAMRFVAASRSHSAQQRIITAGFIMVLLASFVLAALVLGSARRWEVIWQLPVGVPAIAAALAVALAARNYFDAVGRGLGRFKVQALVRLAEALTVLGGSVLIAVIGSRLSWRGFVGVVMAAAAVASALYIAAGMERYISLALWRTEAAHRMWRYIRFGLLGAAGAVMLVSADKILVGRILGAPQLGIYAAYHFLSVQIALQLSYVFVNVFFPSVSRHQDKRAIVRKLDRLVALTAGPAWLASILVLVGGLAALSDAYPLSWPLVIGMSLFAVTYFVYQVYWWFITSLGAEGVRFTSLSNLLAGITFLGSIYLLAPHLALLAPAASWLLSAACLGIAWFWWRRRFIRTMQSYASAGDAAAQARTKDQAAG